MRNKLKVIRVILPPLIILVSLLISPASARAAKLEVSNSPRFSEESRNFNSGDNIYIKVQANNSGSSKRVLNLRDSSYKLLNTSSLTSNGGNMFSTNITAPETPGYYSLEAVVEEDGANTTSVKTIQVGNSKDSNVNVIVNNSSTSESESLANESLQSESVDSSPKTETSGEQINLNQDIILDDTNSKLDKGIFSSIFTLIKLVAISIWPF